MKALLDALIEVEIRLPWLVLHFDRLRVALLREGGFPTRFDLSDVPDAEADGDKRSALLGVRLARFEGQPSENTLRALCQDRDQFCWTRLDLREALQVAYSVLPCAAPLMDDPAEVPIRRWTSRVRDLLNSIGGLIPLNGTPLPDLTDAPFPSRARQHAAALQSLTDDLKALGGPEVASTEAEAITGLRVVAEEFRRGLRDHPALAREIEQAWNRIVGWDQSNGHEHPQRYALDTLRGLSAADQDDLALVRLALLHEACGHGCLIGVPNRAENLPALALRAALMPTAEPSAWEPAFGQADRANVATEPPLDPYKLPLTMAQRLMAVLRRWIEDHPQTLPQDDQPTTLELVAERAATKAVAALGARSDANTPIPSLPELGRHDREAWQASLVDGMTQRKIAAALRRKYPGEWWSQPRVSEAIKRARAHAEASGLADKVARQQSGAPARTLDPAVAEQGPRTDGRSRHLRERAQQIANEE